MPLSSGLGRAAEILLQERQESRQRGDRKREFDTLSAFNERRQANTEANQDRTFRLQQQQTDDNARLSRIKEQDAEVELVRKQKLLAADEQILAGQREVDAIDSIPELIKNFAEHGFENATPEQLKRFAELSALVLRSGNSINFGPEGRVMMTGSLPDEKGEEGPFQPFDLSILKEARDKAAASVESGERVRRVFNAEQFDPRFAKSVSQVGRFRRVGSGAGARIFDSATGQVTEDKFPGSGKPIIKKFLTEVNGKLIEKFSVIIEDPTDPSGLKQIELPPIGPGTTKAEIDRLAAILAKKMQSDKKTLVGKLLDFFNIKVTKSETDQDKATRGLLKGEE